MKLWRERARGRAYLGVESTVEDVECEAECCQEALGKVFDATAKKIRICARSTRCWNGEIKERKSELGRGKRRKRRLTATAQPKAELLRLIRRATDRMWNDPLKNLRGVRVWRTVEFANPRAGATVEALTDRDGKQENTVTAKEKMLRRESFLQNQHDQDSELPQAG